MQPCLPPCPTSTAATSGHAVVWLCTLACIRGNLETHHHHPQPVPATWPPVRPQVSGHSLHDTAPWSGEPFGLSLLTPTVIYVRDCMKVRGRPAGGVSLAEEDCRQLQKYSQDKMHGVTIRTRLACLCAPTCPAHQLCTVPFLPHRLPSDDWRR